MRSEQYRFLKQRVVGCNVFAKEFSQGLPTPFFPSDFFHFGLTEDLLAIWDMPLFTDYQCREELLGKRQHANYPWPQLHVEQMLWTTFIKKYMALDFPHKYADDQGQRTLSEHIFANNLILAERSELSLEVPARLEQNDGAPYTHYSLLRWRQLYKTYCDPGHLIEHEASYSKRFKHARLRMFIYQGLKQKARLAVAKIISARK